MIDIIVFLYVLMMPVTAAGIVYELQRMTTDQVTETLSSDKRIPMAMALAVLFWPVYYIQTRFRIVQKMLGKKAWN